MYELDPSTPAGFLSAFWQLTTGALGLDPRAFSAALDAPGGTVLTLSILFLGGMSDALGQSVALFANRVRPRRFVLSLAASAGVLVASVAFWAVSIWLIAALVFGADRPFTSVLTVVALSHAPLLLGFLALLPYLGIVVYRLLRVWVLLALVVGVTAVAPFNIWQALLCCAPGWVVLELVTRLPILRRGEPRRETQELADQFARRMGSPGAGGPP